MSNIYQEIDTGLRHSKRTCSPFTGEETVTLHHWDGGDIVLETGGIGTVKGRYLRGVNLICQVIDEGVFFYRLNGHGDVVQRVNGVTNKGLSTWIGVYEYSAILEYDTGIGIEPLFYTKMLKRPSFLRCGVLSFPKRISVGFGWLLTIKQG